MSAKAAFQNLDFELILEDGVPVETWYHRLQMVLFLELARYRMLELGQRDFLLNGDMFIYYSLEQARAVAEEERQLALFEQGRRPERPKKTAYRGPDAFLIKGVSTHKRDVWKAWEEDDRYPDLILELLSPSTAAYDYGEKKKIYQDVFKTSEYFLYTPDSETVDGFRRLDNAYQRIPPSAERRLWSRELEVEIGVWHGEYDGQTADWLRLFYPDGRLVPTNVECIEQERRRADAAEHELTRLRAQLDDV
jgi:Uma2 family endonuclease